MCLPMGSAYMHSSSEYSRFDVKFARNIDFGRKYVLYRDTFNFQPNSRRYSAHVYTVEHFLRLVSGLVNPRGGSLNR